MNTEVFQRGCRNWVIDCMGEDAAKNKVERNFRFTEEAIELVQSCGCSKEDVLKIVDYVYGRPLGEPFQEVGGTMTTLASLCNAQGIDLGVAADTELSRCWTLVGKIRAKALAKRTHAALPGVPT